ncbi:MAG TPA: IPT/TIG domain-containing protein [Kineosporiaceae bacterium]|nr:IPT/TIG domain-containing protein [Kineosporiaceae bacterium]
MGLYNAAGTTRYTKANVPVTEDPDPIVVVDDDLYSKIPYVGEKGPDYGPDAETEGGYRALVLKAGTKIRRSELDRLYFPTAVVDTVTPATGLAAGGTAVVIRGSYLDGATKVTFGGTDGTAFSVVSPSEIHVTSPAHAAGAVDVVVVDDSGNATKTSGFTYA